MNLYDLDDILNEKWSRKYKRSINCNNPKGFSQRAHCQGRNKNEAVTPITPVPTTNTKLPTQHRQVPYHLDPARKDTPAAVIRLSPQAQQQLKDKKESVDSEAFNDLDKVLVKLCNMVVEGQLQDPERFGMVAACIIDPNGRRIYGINVPDRDGLRRHAERVALDRYVEQHGDVPNGSTCVTTCSPCTRDMTERHGEDCADLLKSYNIKRVYCGYRDPSQEDRDNYEYTKNPRIQKLCAEFASTFIDNEPNNINESTEVTNKFIKKFLPWLQKEIGLDQLPRIKLVDKLDVPSFGEWDDVNKILVLATAGRHPVDVLRTMAHELTHYRQNLEGRLNPESGETGSDEENEANAEAGVILRKFNSEHPEYIATNLDENFAGKKQGETITQGDVLRLQGQIRRLKDGTAQQRERGIRLERQLRTFLNTHKKPNYAVGVNEDRHPNDVPPGPEIKPTMPRGTVRVDVSDVYDWYKLGTNISNLKQADANQFGKGPPSTIVSFGDEETEHKYIKDLEKLGLDTTDIDPVDPDQPPGMPRQKTDPTFNVDENFADGRVKGKSRPGRVKRSGASCKGSVTDLRARARKYGGEKGKMYHWCANMKSGKKK